MRVKVILENTETGDRDYMTTKNKQKHPERLEVKKYSPKLQRYVVYRETK